MLGTAVAVTHGYADVVDRRMFGADYIAYPQQVYSWLAVKSVLGQLQAACAAVAVEMHPFMIVAGMFG